MNGAQATGFWHNHLLRCPNRLLDLSSPKIMAILNITDDSFYAGSRTPSVSESLRRAELYLQQGAAVLDVGGVSSRPGSQPIREEEELRRVIPVVAALCQNFPDAIISVDTWRARVAEEAVSAGASMINDISAGRMDAALLPTVAQLRVPYVLMHMQGTPATMQLNPQYTDVVQDIFAFLKDKLLELHALGIYDVLVDPGFGFGKSLHHNYRLLAHLSTFQALGCPMLVGLSRKSMAYRPLGLTPESALNATTALHMIALQQGARLLRVHDVAEAMHVIHLWELLHQEGA
ncbi:MAG: dihydropteroate synthase [Chitinophagales bacterium]|nr:dihydropteroate synthase [Chitinophagales bacterium]MDW8428752.1 dihydropteroate synthase [Chitinophagales bacterium]